MLNPVFSLDDFFYGEYYNTKSRWIPERALHACFTIQPSLCRVHVSLAFLAVTWRTGIIDSTR